MENSIPMGLMLAIIGRTFKQKLDEKAAAMGLTAVQLRVLGEISRLESEGVPEIYQKDLEQAEQVTHPTMTGIIKRLENKGFVTCEPSTSDRRYKKISCTEKVADIQKEIENQNKEILKEMCRGFTSDQVEEFTQMIQIILRNIVDA